MLHLKRVISHTHLMHVWQDSIWRTHQITYDMIYVASNQSCRTQNESCHIRKESTSFICMCDMTHSCVTRHLWMHTHINALSEKDKNACDRTHSYLTWLFQVWHDSFMWDVGTHSYVTRRICTWERTHSHVTWLSSRLTRLIHVLTRLIYIYDMINSYVWHEKIICVTSLLHVWHTFDFWTPMSKEASIWRDSHVNETWLTHMWLGRDSWIWHIYDVTNMYMWYQL